jgi:hypothetical protein
VVAHSNALYDHTSARIANFDLPAAASKVLPGDLDGDGIKDLLFEQGGSVYLFRNPSKQHPQPHTPLGTGENVTLY